jgi:hypothetical protein
MARRLVESAERQFRHYKALGDEVLTRTPENYLQWHVTATGTDIASIVLHITVHMSTQWGIMLQTDLNTSHHNGHTNRKLYSRAELITIWEQGWSYLFKHLEHTADEALLNSIQIKDRSFTLFDIIAKKLTHIAYHIGQMTYVAKQIIDQQISPSINHSIAQDYTMKNSPTPQNAMAFSALDPIHPNQDQQNKE